jgi:ADP-heptose:LPS heptosyltransferase
MKKILIYNSGGGLGDSIQLMPLLLSLQKHYEGSEFFYLGAHENHFQGNLKEFGLKINSLELGIKYFGFRWWHFFTVKNKFLNKNYKTFDLIIDLQSKLRNTIILKKIPHSQFYSSTFGFKFCSNKALYSSKDHLVNLNMFLRTEIELSNFDLNSMPIKYRLEAEKLLPNKNYIGLSITQGNVYRKKSWSIENFINLAKILITKNKTPVFFIEKEKFLLINRIKEQIPTALFPEKNSNISCPALVTALASRLDKAISIDNGVMHMISLANIPMIVLFGPTDSEKFAPKNNDVKILDSKKIYNSDNINSITVDDVEKLV